MKCIVRSVKLRRNIVCKLRLVLLECDDFFCSISLTYDGAVLLQHWLAIFYNKYFHKMLKFL